MTASNSAVAVIDTGVDAANTSFRGRVAAGTSTTIGGGTGNDDFAAGPRSGADHGPPAARHRWPGTRGGTGGTGTTAAPEPTRVGGLTSTPTATAPRSRESSPSSSPGDDRADQRLRAVHASPARRRRHRHGRHGDLRHQPGHDHRRPLRRLPVRGEQPYVQDPVRPADNDRVIAASLAFGTSQTFATEQTAYKQYPQVVISFKNQLDKLLKVGIAPIAASGQFGSTAPGLRPHHHRQRGGPATTPRTRRLATSTGCPSPRSSTR